jgi:hypothetical protein
MKANVLQCAVAGVLLASLAACGGGGASSAGTTPPVSPQMVTMPLLVSDASNEDWATVGVKILSVALVPQGGGANVNVYTAASPVGVTNLVQLDNLSDVIGNPSLAAGGTFTGAVITISANPGDVELVTSSDPQTGFPLAQGVTVDPSAIQIQKATGTAPNMTVPIKVTFESPITVASGATTPIDIEFDLSHPAFIVGHTPPAANGATVWAVNFDGPVRHHPVDDVANLVLRHTYGTVGSVASDNSSFTITKDLPQYPATTPEQPVSTGVSLTISADATNGTIFYDVDGKTVSTIKDFSTVAALLETQPAEYVRVAARYQENGTLVAVRVWASSSFNSVWASPEGHVRHVDTSNDVVTIDNEDGQPVRLTVDANTQFFFRQPANGLADATPIGTGTGFLTADNLVRGFKVHATAVDITAVPLVAQTIDIETADYSGTISNPTADQFTYTRAFATVADDYSVTLPYISSTTPNGKVDNAAITGFDWWYFTYPTLADTGSGAIADFVNATGAANVNFGGSYGNVKAFGVSYNTWGDWGTPPAATMGWGARDAILEPVRLPLGTVTTPYGSNTFAMALVGNNGNPGTVDVSTTSGSATLVYQVDRTNGIVTITAQDITSPAGLAAMTAGLALNAPVRVWGVPETDGNLKAYVIEYFTGVMPSN